MFKNAGLPVVPTLRVSSVGTLLLTDMKADGSEIYGKGFVNSWNPYARNGFRSSREINKTFVDLTAPETIHNIEEKTHEYAKIASEAGIKLPTDDPFELIVHPDKSWELIILDLEQGYKMPNNNAGRDYLETENEVDSKCFLEDLQSARKLLLIA